MTCQVFQILRHAHALSPNENTLGKHLYDAAPSEWRETQSLTGLFCKPDTDITELAKAETQNVQQKSI